MMDDVGLGCRHGASRWFMIDGVHGCRHGGGR